MKRILFSLLLACTAVVMAQENKPVKVKMTLEDAKKMALESNPNLAIVKARIEAAAASVDQAKAAYWPTLDLKAGIGRVRDKATRPNRDFNNTTAYNLGLSTSWLIYDGSQRRFQVLNAKYNLFSAQEADRDAQRLLLQEVASSFYSALLAQDYMNIAKEDADFNRILLDDAQKRHDGGIAKPSEVKNFQLKVQNAEADYISSEKSWRISIVALGALLAINRDEIWESIELVPPAGAEEMEYDFNKLYEYAINHRPDLMSVNAKIQNCRDAVDAAKDTQAPVLSAYGNYEYERTHSAHFNKHYDRDINYGLNLTWNLFNGGKTTAAITTAEAELKAALREREDLVININSEIRRGILAIESSKKQLQIQDETLATAKEIRDLVHEEYIGGTATITRLNETQTDVTKAASERSAAYIQLLNSIENIHVTTSENIGQ